MSISNVFGFVRCLISVQWHREAKWKTTNKTTIINTKTYKSFGYKFYSLLNSFSLFILEYIYIYASFYPYYANKRAAASDTDNSAKLKNIGRYFIENVRTRWIFACRACLARIISKHLTIHHLNVDFFCFFFCLIILANK